MQVQSPILNRLFNTFDAPVRFFYTRAGFFSRFMNRLMFWKLYSSNLSTLDLRFREMNEMLSTHSFDMTGKTALELGPGNASIGAYILLLNGAKKVVLVDKFPRNQSSRKQRAFHDREIRFLRKRYPGREFFFLDEQGRAKPEFVEFIAKDLTGVDHLQLDFLYSFSVLEHLRRIHETIRKMSALLKPGGMMFHHIDLRDHYNFSAPFLFYKYSDRVWNSYLTKEGLSYTNRWRYDDFREAFQTSGFTTIGEHVQRFPMRERRLHPRFQNSPNLDIGILDIVAQKSS